MSEQKTESAIANLEGDPYTPAATELAEYKQRYPDKWLALSENYPLLSAWLERQAAKEASRLECFLASDDHASRKNPTLVKLAPPYARISLIDLCSQEELALIEAAKRLQEKHQTPITLKAYAGGEAEFLKNLKRLYPALSCRLEDSSVSVETEALGELKRLAEQPPADQSSKSLADCFEEDPHAFASIRRRYPSFFAHCLEPHPAMEVEIGPLKSLEKVAHRRNSWPEAILLDLHNNYRNAILTASKS